MGSLDALPEGKRPVVEQLVEDLSRVRSVVAVVLAGSYASGTQHGDSDIDLGIYYFEDEPFSVGDIRRVAESISVKGSPTVTGFYEWGPWVNGGAWIETAVGKVDFLYRNVDQVERTIKDAQDGVFEHNYDQQSTYGFYSVAYLAETRICVPLRDTRLVIARLKRLVEEYPPELKKTIMIDSLWSAEFTLSFMRSCAADGDVYNTVGCLTRVLSYMTQALFALNESYYINDKAVMDEVASFRTLPSGYRERIARLLTRPGETIAELEHTASELEAVWSDVVSITAGVYQPKYGP